MLTWRVTSSGHDPIWPPSHLIAGLEPPSPPQLPGINNRSIYWVTICTVTDTQTDSHPSQVHLPSVLFSCPDIFLFPLSSSRWWMYLQIFLPSFVLSQLYNWPARASVSRVSAPRVGWNWSHYGDGITATSDPAPRAAILKSQYWHYIEPLLRLSL